MNFETTFTDTGVGTGSADTTYSTIPCTTSNIARLWWMEINLTSSAPAGTSLNTPVCTITLQSSMDGTNYDDLQAFTQTNTTAAVERKTVIRTTSVHFGKFLRIKKAVGTADTSVATYTLSVHIIGGSNGS